jgi:hypothetical protein
LGRGRCCHTQCSGSNSNGLQERTS